jgi:hypothetical protein
MANKKAMLANVVTKYLDVPRTMTAGGTLTNLSPAFVVGTDKKYLAAKALFPFVKAGGATAVSVQIELQSDTGTAGAYQSLTNTDGVTITPIGTDAGHGYVATTGAGICEANFDLSQVKVGTNLKVKVTCIFVAANTDTVIGETLLQLAGARKEPPTSTVVSTVA